MKYTSFALAIADFLVSSEARNGMACTWTIAQTVFPEKWKRKQGRGALIGHIDRVTVKHPEDFGRIPPKDQFDSATLFLFENAAIRKHL